jgi:hypothetical protein
MNNVVFHISDRPGIQRFEPRIPPSPSSGVTDAVVWAVGERLLHNYLLPRNCPRVTFYAVARSTPADVERLLGQTTARYVVAIESRWLPRVQRERLWCYMVPAATFEPVDEGAGYYVSRAGVVPLGVREIDDLLGELVQRDVELRVMPSLWRLRDAVVNSTLQYSIIRMRNAQPREEG